LQKERGVVEKKERKYMLKKNRKHCAPIKEHKKKKRREKHDNLQNKSKWRISKQGVFRKTIKLHD
jgi:hypothetical protein